jgi:glycosyltransferase involved in cell wall biosynthesis
MAKILYVVAEDHYFCSHRLELAAYMQQLGHTVAVATNCSSNPKYQQEITAAQIQIYQLKYFCRSSVINPFKELLAIRELYRVYKSFRPDLVHHVALKPVIYGSIAAKLARVKNIINALAGLGFVFTPFKYNNSKYNNLKIMIKQKILQLIVYKLLKLIISNKFSQSIGSTNDSNKTLLLQNKDDLEVLKYCTKLQEQQFNYSIIPGSGINMAKYWPSMPLNHNAFTSNKIKIVLISRLLWTKGISEFVAAAKQVKKYFLDNNIAVNPEFILYGDLDPKNPASISYQDLSNWQERGLITWKNYCHDLVAAYSDCHIAVLPSYREGLPKTLLEAAACARAIITTDVPGCREIVSNGVNGYLVPKSDSNKLAQALLQLIQNQQDIIKMGKSSRERVINKFSSEVILPQMLQLYNLS